MYKMRTQLQPLPLPPKFKRTPPCTHPIRTLRIPKTAFPNPALRKGTSSSFTVVSLWPSSLQQFAWLSVVLPLRTNSRVHGDSTTNPKPPNSSSTSKAIPQKAHSISAAKKRWGSFLSVSTWPLSRWRVIRPSSN